MPLLHIITILFNFNFKKLWCIIYGAYFKYLVLVQVGLYNGKLDCKCTWHHFTELINPVVYYACIYMYVYDK